MKRWNPNLYSQEGLRKGFNPQYLEKLVEIGRKIQSQNVPVIYSLAHLASLSRTQYSDLHSIVARASLYQPDYPYKNFPIKKRKGGKRWISVPTPPLMAVQRWISSEILNNVAPHRAASAYVRGASSPLVSHAEQHCGARWILKIDIKNFFENITERQVFDVFRSLNYPKLLCFEMARLCTRVTPRRKGKRWNTLSKERDYNVEEYNCTFIGSLPQGAPSSPALSNLVCRKMDIQLEELAHKHKAGYSRYADDLCFSFIDSSREDVFRFKKMVNLVLWENGFTENRKKTQIIPPGSRKTLVGLNINQDRPTISRELRDRIRMHLYYSHKIGISDHCKNKGFRSVIGFRNHLRGLIMHVSTINPNQGKSFMQQFDKLPWLDFDI